MSVVSDDVEPLTFVFEDDGLVPNNPLPLLIYKGAIDVANAHPEKTIEGLFGANGWGDDVAQRRLRLPALPCHGARGARRRPRPGPRPVRRRPRRGDQIEAGDVAILPAGTGHQRLFASHDFRVVGAYPPGSHHACHAADGGKYM